MCRKIWENMALVQKISCLFRFFADLNAQRLWGYMYFMLRYEKEYKVLADAYIQVPVRRLLYPIRFWDMVEDVEHHGIRSVIVFMKLYMSSLISFPSNSNFPCGFLTLNNLLTQWKNMAALTTTSSLWQIHGSREQHRLSTTSTTTFLLNAFAGMKQ